MQYNKAETHTLLGTIMRIYGLKGAVIVDFEYPIRSLDGSDYLFIQMDHTLVPYALTGYTLEHPQLGMLHFRSVSDRTAAYNLLEKTIWLPSNLLPAMLLPKEYLPEELLVGYIVYDVQEGNLGTVQRIETFPMHICLVTEYQGKALLIPYQEALVASVDHEHKKIVVCLPAGFLAALGYTASS